MLAPIDRPPAAPSKQSAADHPARETAPGVWLAPLPLSASPIGSVNVVLLRHRQGFLLVDAGYDDDACWQVLEAAFATAGGSLADVTGLILTHNHPDHVGLARRVLDASGAWLALHPLDAVAPDDRPFGPFLDELAVELRLAGVPKADASEMLAAAQALAKHTDGPPADRRLRDGDLVAEDGLTLRVLETPGHTRGHVALLHKERRLLIGGDLLLDGGEIQLGLVSQPDDDPVHDLQRSLERVSILDVDTTLPGHWEPFDDLKRRAVDARAALNARLVETEETLRRSALTAWEVAHAAKFSRPWKDMGTSGRRFVVMQALAWCRGLAAKGRATRQPGVPERYRAPAR